MTEGHHSLEKLAAEVADLRGRVEIKEVAEAHRRRSLDCEVQEIRQCVGALSGKAKEPPPHCPEHQQRMEAEVQRLCQVVKGIQDRVDELQRRPRQELASREELWEALEQRLNTLERRLETRLRSWQTEQIAEQLAEQLDEQLGERLAELPQKLAQSVIQVEERLLHQMKQLTTEATVAAQAAAVQERKPAQEAQAAATLLEKRFDALEHKMARAFDPQAHAAMESGDPTLLQRKPSHNIKHVKSNASIGSSVKDRSSRSSETSESSERVSEVFSSHHAVSGRARVDGGDPLTLQQVKSEVPARQSISLFGWMWKTRRRRRHRGSHS